MIISWYGQSCFKIQAKPKRGLDEIVIITDPFDKEIGLRPPQGRADIITVSHDHQDHNNTKIAEKNEDCFVADAPGEYARKGVTIEGIESFHDNEQGQKYGFNTIFLIETEDLRICHLGDLGHALSEEQVEQIGDVDVLLIPIGGTYTLDTKAAEKVVGQLEPKIIIPMHFKVPGLKINIDDEKAFCKEFGEKSNGESRLVLRKKDLEEVENKLVMLSIKN